MNKTAITIGLAILVMLTACGGGTPKQEAKAVQAAQQNTIELEAKKEPVQKAISVTAIGDVLLHSSIYSEAKNETGYNFAPMFQEVKLYLKETTLTVANQESIMGGEAIGVSTYPTFNSPDEIGDTLKDAGVDVVTMANNHTLDQGEAGIKHAAAQYEKIGLAYTGAYANKQDGEKLTIETTPEGISVAFLSYTYGTNGIPVPEGKDYLVNLIDKQKIKDDIKRAKQAADATVVSLHFGTEYQDNPNEEQKQLVQLVADEGATAILGSHPHVLQPVQWLTGKDGNKTLAIYSLGNFIAAQEETDRRIGAAFQFDLEKEGQTVTAANPRMLLTYLTFTNWHDYRIEPMYQLPGMKTAYEAKKKHMAKLVPELTFIEEAPES
ncbi:CapA family protein [Terribacillus halophilus]|uniref:CapA family protein n=1 Tax=Terribacillus halophilus TaxID=361279 RepID=UPI0009877A5E|nr:CapA family protein [Terribacillus halophilus]